MIRLLVAAGLACLAFTAHCQSGTRYSWTTSGGPYFRTPAEACIWARRLYDDPEAQTMNLGKDGFCRESNGAGHLYIKPHVSQGRPADATGGHLAARQCELLGLAGRERPASGCAEDPFHVVQGRPRHAVEVAPAGTYRSVISLDEPAPARPTRRP